MDKNVVRVLARFLGWVDLVVGTIGSFIVAYRIGKLNSDWYSDFDLKSAVIVFVVSMFSVLVLAVILFGIDNMLSELIDITSKVRMIDARTSATSSHTAPSHTAPSNASNGTGYSLSKIANGENTGNEWVCIKCGGSNPKSSQQCKHCGEYK